MEIKNTIDKFLNGNGKNKGRLPNERYSSFDYCYNYFFSFYKNQKITELANDENMQNSCLHLGFYLASWGMMRGSSFLLEKSVRHLQDLIRAISEMDSKLWKIDINNYDDDINIDLLIDCKDKIVKALGGENAKTWDTLVTKIMLGVFGNVPAYDKNFKVFLKKEKYFQSFNKKSLIQIKHFYEKNQKDFDSYNLYTYDFLKGKDTKVKYTKAKILDMYGFIVGQ